MISIDLVFLGGRADSDYSVIAVFRSALNTGFCFEISVILVFLLFDCPVFLSVWLAVYHLIIIVALRDVLNFITWRHAGV